MKNWKEEKALYEVHEFRKDGHEAYPLMMTGRGISDFCKAKNNAYGYIPEVGGDKKYSCWAVLLNY